jgi:hypothetical protein
MRFQVMAYFIGSVTELVSLDFTKDIAFNKKSNPRFWCLYEKHC